MAMKKGAKIVEYSKLEHKVAALWTRVSTEKQALKNLSLVTQERTCREFAERNGITIKKTFGGTHESAKMEGKLYKEMIAAVAKDKEINVILVYSFDRFSRAGDEAILTKAYLKSKGIYVISATQATDPDSASGTFMENIIFLFNQFENDLRRDKCMAGMRECLKKGDWYSKPPLGYDSRKEGKRHILTINEQGQILRNAFLWKANEGASDIVIVSRLRAMGLNIDRKHLNKILHNKFYCGYIQHSLLGNEIIKGNQEILIDEDTFNKANGIRVGYEHQEITPDFPLKRHIKCYECGNYLTGYTTKGRCYYKCNTKGCKSNHSAAKMHEKYVDRLNRYAIPDELKPIFKKVLLKVFQENEQEQDRNRSILIRNRTELEKKIKTAKVRFGTGEISEDVFSATMCEMESELANIKMHIEELDYNYSNLEKFIDTAFIISCQLGTLWERSDFHDRQAIQNLVYPKGIFYDKENDNYRTIEENAAFEVFRKFSASYKIEKEKTATDFSLLPSLVGMRRLERPTPTSRT